MNQAFHGNPMKTLFAMATEMSHIFATGKCLSFFFFPNACHHNSFSFYRMFLKLADKVDMDEISKSSKTGHIGSLILELHPLNC